MADARNVKLDNSKSSLNLVQECTQMLGIDSFGLDDMDRKILNCIISDYNSGPVGISTISASLSEEIETLEDVYEPYLIQLGFLQKLQKVEWLLQRQLNTQIKFWKIKIFIEINLTNL